MQNLRKKAMAAGKALGLTGLALVTFVENALAALPTEATAAFTTISGNITDIFAAIWPVVAVVTGGFVLIRLFKKGTGAI